MSFAVTGALRCGVPDDTGSVPVDDVSRAGSVSGVYRFLLTPRWLGFAALALLLAAIMVGLGDWQLHRYHERAAINDRIAAGGSGRRYRSARCWRARRAPGRGSVPRRRPAPSGPGSGSSDGTTSATKPWPGAVPSRARSATRCSPRWS